MLGRGRFVEVDLGPLAVAHQQHGAGALVEVGHGTEPDFQSRLGQFETPLLIGGATVRNATIGHVIIGTFLFQSVLTTSLPVVNELVVKRAGPQFGNIPEGTPDPTVWPLANAGLYTVIWVVIIIAVFAPLSVRRYQRASKR